MVNASSIAAARYERRLRLSLSGGGAESLSQSVGRRALSQPVSKQA